MEREQTTIHLFDETKEFASFLKNLDEKQQIGLNLTIEGLKLLVEKTKKAVKNR